MTSSAKRTYSLLGVSFFLLSFFTRRVISAITLIFAIFSLNHVSCLFTGRHKAITNLGLLIQFFADKLMGHGDVIDYKLLSLKVDIASVVIIMPIIWITFHNPSLISDLRRDVVDKSALHCCRCYHTNLLKMLI